MVRYEYLRPASLEEALALLSEKGDDATLVAGATDVLVGIRRGKIAPRVLLSLKGVKGFDSIEGDGAGARVGALATHRQVAESSLINASFSALSDAASHIGSPQIRNVATIGGNIANGLPSADGSCPLMIFNATVRIIGPAGERLVPIDQFYKGPGKTDLRHDEVLLGFILPPVPPGSASCYRKVARRNAMELAILGMAMMLAVDVVDAAPLKEAFGRAAPVEGLYEALDAAEISCREARIALGVAAPTPIRAPGAEAVLKGSRLTTSTLSEAGERASEEARPRDTMRGAAWFRREMIRVLPKRMVFTCLERILFPGKEAGVY